MDAAATIIWSPWWWLSVVGGTVILHVVAVRADRWLTGLAKFGIDRWKSRSEKSARLTKERIAAIQADDRVLQYFLHLTDCHWHSAIVSLFYSVAGFALATLLAVVADIPGDAPVSLAFSNREQTAFSLALFGAALAFCVALLESAKGTSISRDVRVALGEDALRPLR